VPQPQWNQNGTGSLTLTVGRQGSLATLDNALSRTADFGLKREAAEKIIQEMIEEIKMHWQEEHKKAGVPEEKLSALHHSYSRCNLPLYP
jgi:serine/threonine-protein kinase HipA